MGCPPHTKSFSVPLPLPRLPIVCLNFEQTIAGISISIHFRTAAANTNNFQTHPVCNLLSTNEINTGENIFNNNVMQNGISKIVKIGKFSQFLLKSTLHHTGGRIYVDILPYNLAQKSLCYRPERSIHQSVRFGGKQDSLIGLRVFRGEAGSNLDVPRRGITLPLTNSDKEFYDFRGTS